MALTVGLTQRVSKDERTGEFRDSLDQRWTSLLMSLSYVPIPIPNQIDPVDDYINALSLDAVILTGGGNLEGYGDPITTSPERERVENSLIDYCVKSDTPLLGVCRGLQALAVHFGGRLVEVSGHVATTHPVQIINDGPTGIPLEHSDVNSYHDYGINPSDLPSDLSPIAMASDGTIEAAVLAGARVVGIMWHPEREYSLTQADRALFENLFGAGSS